MRVDEFNRSGDVGFAINHIPLINDNGGQGGDAQAPGIDNVLIGFVDALLQGSAAFSQALLHDDGGAGGVLGEVGGQFGFDALSGVQLNDPHRRVFDLHWMASISNDDDVSGEGVGSEQQRVQPGGDGEWPQPGQKEWKGIRQHVEPPCSC